MKKYELQISELTRKLKNAPTVNNINISNNAGNQGNNNTINITHGNDVVKNLNMSLQKKGKIRDISSESNFSLKI